MDRCEIANLGLSLAEDLLAEANKYHVKSDKHEILCYESAGVRGMSDELLNGDSYRYDLIESTLLSDWGCTFANEIPSLYERVRCFRRLYQDCKLLELRE